MMRRNVVLIAKSIACFLAQSKYSARAATNRRSAFELGSLWRLTMAAVNLTDVAAHAGTPNIVRVDPSDSTGQRFSTAMQKAATDPAFAPDRVDAAKTADAAAGASADAQERARRALNLNPAQAAHKHPAHGDAILQGLQTIRGTFAAQEARINNLVAHSAADTNALMAAQWEVTKLTVLVDMTSKLAGKFTQLPETLLKGQ